MKYRVIMIMEVEARHPQHAEVIVTDRIDESKNLDELKIHMVEFAVIPMEESK